MRPALISLGGMAAIGWLMACALIGAETDRQDRIDNQETIAQATYSARMAQGGW